MALGITQQLPTDDRHKYSKQYLDKTLCVLMGGRVAEELVLDQVTTGAGNDIERATNMAHKMVCKWGMSKALGPLSYGERDDEIFLGKELLHHKNFSDETSRRIDAEVRKIVEDAYHRAETILTENMDMLHAIAAALLERETISARTSTFYARRTPAAPG
jgi:cell division protease FtsH